MGGGQWFSCGCVGGCLVSMPQADLATLPVQPFTLNFILR